MDEKGLFDRAGDWSLRAARYLLANPALTIGGATVVLFVVARVPTEMFYRRFGLRPEDVGLNSVQVLLQGCSLVLIISLVVGVLYGILMPFLILIRPRALRRKNPDKLPLAWAQYRGAARRSVRVTPIAVPVISIVFATVILTVGAFVDTAAIKGGKAPTGRFMPWRAVPVNVVWTDRQQRIQLPNCLSLFYLGEGNGRVALYDSRDERTLRLDSEAVQLDFPDSCRPN